MTRSEIIEEILQDPTPPTDPEIFETRSQAMFDEMAGDVHCWAFVVARYLTRGNDEDRLLLCGLLESYQRGNKEAIAAFSAAFSGES